MASVNVERARQLAAIVAELPDAAALDLASDVTLYPPQGDPNAISYFFVQCLQNFGFWTEKDGRYEGPLYGTVGGVRSKGADLLARILMRRYAETEHAFDADLLLLRAERDWNHFLADDFGAAFPDMEARRQQTIAYAKWFIRERLRPDDIVAEANASPRPVARFLELMGEIPGYDRDPLQKRQRLLAMCMTGRPERFLRDDDAASAELPIIDYHAMRVALRTGLVVLQPGDRADNADRKLVDAATELRIREAAYDAFVVVQRLSGRRLAVMDNAVWQARRYCPEMQKPDCGSCTFRTACDRRTELFQPVIRTTDY